MTSAAPAPGAAIPLDTLPNLRDVGGYRTGDGREVRRGLLYRSVLLGRLGDEDARRLRELSLRTVFDFRTAAEQTATPDREVGAREIGLDVLADRTGKGPASLLAKMDDPAAISAALSGEKGREMMIGAYRELIDLPSADAAYRRFFETLAEPDALPALFHCTTGKDRTGWAAASLLLFLGVSEEDVFHDYLLTNEQLLPALEPVFDQFESIGGEPAMLRPVLSVDRTYLQTALDIVDERYGSIESYMSDGLGLDERILDELRLRLLHESR